MSQGRKNADDALILALAAGRTVAEAALAAKVSERTAYRRLEQEDFRSRVDDARAEMVGRTIGALAALGDEATKALQGLIGARSETVKLGAVRTALEFLFRGHELHTLARQVEDLKKQFEESHHVHGVVTSRGSEGSGGHGGAV